MSGVLGWDPVRKQLFPLSRPGLLVQPTSPALSPWKRAADFLLVGGRRREGEGRAGSPLLAPPPHSEAQPSSAPTISGLLDWRGPPQSPELRPAGTETMRQAAHRPRPP